MSRRAGGSAADFQYAPYSSAMPEVHILSNGPYHVMVTNAGGGYSRWRDLAVTRWSEDEDLGIITEHSCISMIYQPTANGQRLFNRRLRNQGIMAVFLQSRVEFSSRDKGLDTYTEIAVSPEDDIEYRRIRISNFTVKTRTLELTSYAEVALVSPAAEAVHPAFSNLFMQTEVLGSHQAILCSRRPRSAGGKAPWMFHLLIVRGLEQYETLMRPIGWSSSDAAGPPIIQRPWKRTGLFQAQRGRYLILLSQYGAG